MAQLKFASDITASDYPFMFDWTGRTVLQQTAPEGSPQIKTPQILYCENVLPTVQGYKSVSYRNLIAAATPANITFSKRFTVEDAAQNKALIGVTTDSKIYIITSSSYIWLDVTPIGWGGGDSVTVGVANGVSYLYLKQFGCYRINIVAGTLVVQALTGIVAGNIYGMANSMNYLILWDATTIYWSATSNPLDFVPSLITGAGSQIPFDLQGKIVICVQMNNGFVIYTDTNMILSSFSNNTQYPWIFRSANNGSGIKNAKQVTASRDLGFHIAVTYAGILQVTAQGASLIVPEVTDFIAARLYESYDSGTKTVIKQSLVANVLTQLTLLEARYVVMSYGINSMTDALVYDLQLKRWGRLHTAHAECFEVEVDVSVQSKPYNEASEIGANYAAASPSTYNSTASSFNTPPAVGQVFGILRADGSIDIAYLNYDSISDSAVLMLGKYQLTRNYLLDLEEVVVESVPTTNTGLQVYNMSSLDGKDLNAPELLIAYDTNAGNRVYKLRSIGKNHTLLFAGSFNLTAVEITAVLNSRR